MSWVLNEDRRLLRDSAQSFIAGRMPVSYARELRDRGVTDEHAVWRDCAAQGLAAVLIGEADGGLGLGVCEAGIIAEQLGHTLAPTPFLGSAVLATRLLTRAATAAQRQALLPALARGETVMALAVDEGDKHRPTQLACRACRTAGTGSPWRLDGRKTFVVDGNGAEQLIVAARTDGDAGGEIVLLLVPVPSPGLGIESVAMVDGRNVAQLAFDGVRVPNEARLGEGADAVRALDDALDVGRVIAASELLGIADEVFERTVQYLLARKQFDRVIGEFQALQHRAAELFCDLELARALVRAAQAALDAGDPKAPLLALQAKARANLSANRAVLEAVQMHGGIGMTDALDIGLFLRRARVLQEWLGDTAWSLDRAARLAGY